VHDEEQEARWVPATPPDSLVSVVGGASVALAPTAILVSVFEVAGLAPGGSWTAADTARGLLVLPPGPFGSRFVGSLAGGAGRVPIGLGVATWAALVVVGWWTTGQHTEALSSTDDRNADSPPGEESLVGPRRSTHRLLANAVGHGVERLYYRASERGFLRTLVRDGLAVGVGYGLVVAVAVWRAVGSPAVTSEPWTGAVLGGAFAAVFATLGGLVRGCSTA